MDRFGETVDRLALAEEIGVLNDECSGLAIEQPQQLVEIGSAILARLNTLKNSIRSWSDICSRMLNRRPMPSCSTGCLW